MLKCYNYYYCSKNVNSTNIGTHLHHYYNHETQPRGGAVAQTTAQKRKLINVVTCVTSYYRADYCHGAWRLSITDGYQTSPARANLYS